MERLTKYICDRAHGAEGVSAEKLTGAYCRGKFEATALVERLAAIEDILGDGYDLDELREMAQAKREGRCVVRPVGGYSDKDGETALKNAMFVCSFTNNAVNRYAADAIAEKLTRQEAQAALRREQE